MRESLGLEANLPRCGADGACVFPEPDWCFLRFGATRTAMPDGRIVCIGGEHEDFYHPDFCIYNDVVVLRPAGMETVTEDSGAVEIYGYPEDVFPPTDFHSATLVGERIYIIGRLGYAGTRQAGVTPVYALETRGYRMEALAPTGPAPGWVYEHHASYDAARHAITVRGGKVYDGRAQKGDPDHLAAHRLWLDGLRWELINAAEPRRRFVMECEEAPPDFIRIPPEAIGCVSVLHRWLPPVFGDDADYSIDVDGV